MNNAKKIQDTTSRERNGYVHDSLVQASVALEDSRGGLVYRLSRAGALEGIPYGSNEHLILLSAMEANRKALASVRDVLGCLQELDLQFA